MPFKWPFIDAIEVRPVNLDGENASLAQWRPKADRSMAFSQEPHFLFAIDRYFIDRPERHFQAEATLFYGPYPRSAAVLCEDFKPVSTLVESLGFPLLILYPQNLVNPDRGESLLGLLRRLPDLRVQIYTGSASTVELFAGAPESSRIEFLAMPVHPRDFHARLARMYGFELPQWFVAMG